MRSRARIGLVLALLALAASGWWLLQGDDPAPPRHAAVAESPIDASQPATREAAPSRTVVASDSELSHVGTSIPPAAGLPGVSSCVVTAEVVDDAGTPVAGALVEVFAANCERRAPTSHDARDIVWLGPQRTQCLATASTDAEGLCVFRLEREFAYASASHAQFGRSICRAIGELQLGSDRRVQLCLLRPVVVRGTVIDGDCRPVAHARVQCSGEQHGGTEPRGKFVPDGCVSADANGRFEFEIAAGCNGSLSATWNDVRSMTVFFLAKEDLELLVPLATSMSIEGRVVDAAGRPVARARIECMPASFRMTDPGTRSDEQGCFSLPCTAPGRCELIASTREPAGSASAMTEVCVTLADPHPRVELVVATAALRGTVWTHDGRPAADVRLQVLLRQIPGARLQSVSAADGTFTVLRPGGCTIVIAGPLLDDVEVAADATDVRLVQRTPGPELVILGEVFAADGSPARDFTLRWRRSKREPVVPDTSERFRGATDGNMFRLTSPVRGPEWFVVATSAESAPGAVAGPFLDGGEQRVRMQLPEPSSLSLLVLANGRPAIGAQVVLFHELSQTHAEARTDGTGRARFTGRWPGAQQLFVGRGREVLSKRQFELQPGENGELVVDVVL